MGAPIARHIADAGHTLVRALELMATHQVAGD